MAPPVERPVRPRTHLRGYRRWQMYHRHRLAPRARRRQSKLGRPCAVRPLTDCAAQNAGAKRQPPLALGRTTENDGPARRGAHAPDGRCTATTRGGCTCCPPAELAEVAEGRRPSTTFALLPARPNVELTGRRRQDAKPGPQTMHRVPAARAWWPAVGAPVERRVRPHLLQTRAVLESKYEMLSGAARRRLFAI